MCQHPGEQNFQNCVEYYFDAQVCRGSKIGKFLGKLGEFDLIEVAVATTELQKQENAARETLTLSCATIIQAFDHQWLLVKDKTFFRRRVDINGEDP